MFDIKTIKSVAFDIEGRLTSDKSQEEASEFIFSLLERDYQVYLFSTNKDDALDKEFFQHHRLTYLPGDFPPEKATTDKHPDLLLDTTLWVSNNPQFRFWLSQKKLSSAIVSNKRETGSFHVQTSSLLELAALLDPTGFSLQEIVGAVQKHRLSSNNKPLMIGIGGPPHSGYQNLVISLRNALQTAEIPLVELLDLSSLMQSVEALIKVGENADVWLCDAIRDWLDKEIATPLAIGNSVYIDTPPSFLPPDFGAHFPLYYSEETVVLVFGEMPFVEPIRSRFHLTVMLEVPAVETTRRLYELPEGEKFEQKFIDMYMLREGKIYSDYMVKNGLPGHMNILLDATCQNAFRLKEGKHKQPAN